MFLSSCLQLRSKADADRVNTAAKLVVERATDFSTKWEFLSNVKSDSADLCVSLNITRDRQRTISSKHLSKHTIRMFGTFLPTSIMLSFVDKLRELKRVTISLNRRCGYVSLLLVTHT